MALRGKPFHLIVDKNLCFVTIDNKHGVWYPRVCFNIQRTFQQPSWHRRECGKIKVVNQNYRGLLKSVIHFSQVLFLQKLKHLKRSIFKSKCNKFMVSFHKIDSDV